jgi:hypothetical protein
MTFWEYLKFKATIFYWDAVLGCICTFGILVIAFLFIVFSERKRDGK